MNTAFAQFLDESKIEYSTNEPMSAHTTFHIGGPADFMCYPKSVDEIKSIVNWCNKNDFKYFVLGNGSNLLVSDSGIDGAVIVLSKFSDIKLASAIEIECGAGNKLSKLCSFALENSLSGAEFAWGIPGTVGGAIYMNAGAYGSEICNIITECTYIDEEGQLVTADVSALELGYRRSLFTDKSCVIISAKFKLKPEKTDVIKAQMDDLIERRKSKQPLEYASAGSTFKRPAGYFAAALIEECGLKGESVGDAEVSTKHSGFIVNKGNATCSDVLSLIKKVTGEVYLQKSVSLEPEVKIIGR